LPGQALVYSQLAQVTFPPQLAQVMEAAGLDASMAQAKKGLVAFKPKPGGRPLGCIGGIAEEIDKFPQIHALGWLGSSRGIGFTAGSGIGLGHQQPGRGQIPSRGQGRRQGIGTELPGGLIQAEGAWIASSQSLYGKNFPQGKVVVAALKTDFQLNPAAPHTLDDG
jgi:hypothetical protein